ncbi:MAG: hypothetical protein AAFY38_05175 [Pseudomonadota bacterium]
MLDCFVSATKRKTKIEVLAVATKKEVPDTLLSIRPQEGGTVIVEGLSKRLDALGLTPGAAGHVSGVAPRTIERMLSKQTVRRKSVEDLVRGLTEAGIPLDVEADFVIAKPASVSTDVELSNVQGIPGQAVEFPVDVELANIEQNVDALVDKLSLLTRRFRKNGTAMLGVEVFSLMQAKENFDQLFDQLIKIHSKHNS